MYKEICDFAELHGCVMSENRKTATISGYVLLDSSGNYTGMIESIDKKDRKAKSVPTFGSFARTEKQAEPICEKFCNIFDKAAKKHASYVNTMETGKDACASLAALCKFILDYETDDDFAAKVLGDLDAFKFKADKDTISFKIDGKCIEELSDWNDWLLERMKLFNSKKAETNKIISSISGRLQKSVPPENCPAISNVPNDIKAAFGLGYPVYVISAKYPSFESYGFEKAMGSQVGEEDAKLFVAGIEELLGEGKEQYRNKDFQVIYFYDREVDNVIFQSLSNMDEDEIEDLEADISGNRSVLHEMLSAVRTGQQMTSVPNADAEYYMVQFKTPSAGRHYMANEIRGKYGDLVNNLRKWYEDTQILRYDDTSKRMIKTSITKFYSVLMACISNPNLMADKAHQAAEDEFGAIKMSLLDAIYKNTQIPEIFFHRALSRVSKSMSSSGKISRYTWIQLIKCYLIRKGHEIMSDTTNIINSAYACGQLFAVYEDMQWHYSKEKLNKNLAQSYFSAALKQPSVIFPQLADLGVVYLNNINYSGIYTRKLGELAVAIGKEFPRSFTDEEKGSFVLGYYQQKADFMRETQERAAEKKSAENNENKGE